MSYDYRKWKEKKKSNTKISIFGFNIS